MTDIAPWLTLAAGFLLQQLRAFKAFPEWGYLLTAIAVGMFGLWLTAHEPFWTRVFWQAHMGLLVLFVQSVIAGTALAANGASVLTRGLAPPTNSRGN